MKRFSSIALCVGLASLAVGCNKTSWEPSSAKSRHASPAKPMTIEQQERSIELQAQRAKEDIDQAKQAIDTATANAERALRDAATHATSAAKQHGQDLTEFSAELAEDAKDRAEDVPAAVDQELDKQIQRRLKFNNPPQQQE
jgi:hypothetical protein